MHAEHFIAQVPISVFFSLGSNEGDRLHHLSYAASQLKQLFPAAFQSSSVYETAPWGNADQPSFLNMCCGANISTSPESILSLCQSIEQEMGRQRIVHWGQRNIDIDMLFYGSTIMQTPELTLPHPFLAQRRFVLQPLAEIAPAFLHPVLNMPILELLFNCTDNSDVYRYDASAS